LTGRIIKLDKNNIKDIYPLSPMQHGILFHTVADESLGMYFEQITLTLAEEIDLELFEKSFNAVIKEYDVLRTMFIYKNIKEPVQLVLKDRKSNINFEDVSTKADEEKIEYIEAFKKHDRERGFDLSKDMLIRMSIIKTDERCYEVIVNFHHIIMDGWSLGIVIKDILDNYKLLKDKKPLKIIEAKPYSDFIKWIENQEKEEGLSYWNKQLEGYEQKAEIPYGIKRNIEDNRYTLGETTFTLSDGLTNKLTELAKQKGTTLNTIVQIAWGILLHIYNYTEDVVFGSVVSGRPTEIEGIETMVGLFINTIPVRMHFEHSYTFNEIIDQIRDNVFESTKYDYLPLAKIQANTELKRDLINHIMIYENYPVAKEITTAKTGKELELEIKKFEISEQTSYNFNIYVMPGTNMTIKFAYNTAIYDEHQLKNIEGHFKNILRQIADNPGNKLASIEILSDEEKEQILDQFNNTKAYYPNKTIHHLFEEQVEKTPDNIAVVFEENSLTYKQLNYRANQLAKVLREKGVKPNSIVGIMVERSLEMIIGMLGILKAGGAYLPISPDYPDDRVAYMLEDSQAEIMLTQNSIAAGFMFKGEKIAIDNAALDVSEIENLAAINKRSDLAYVMYTSGTTGKPKGVMIPHKALTNFLISMGNKPGLISQDKMLAVTTYCFDIAGLELFLPLVNGAQCFICDPEKVRDVEKLKKEIQKIKPTVMQATPVTWTMLYQAGWNNEEKLKILCGGEALPERLKQFFIDTNSEAWNVFGPTETTIWSTVQLIKEDESITIGAPIANTQIYVLGKNMKPVPIGIPGELYIAGDGLAKGYLNKPELTAEKFISNPFHRGTKLYKTGDLARWLPDGNIEFLGRIDYQVKIRGFRIELGEIESQLNKHQEIQDSVVVVKEQDGIKQLVAYYVHSHNDDKKVLDAQIVRDFLKTTLPSYMIPGIFVELEAIPLTFNEKVDRKALMKRNITLAGTKKQSLPESAIEGKVLKIWQEVLKIAAINTEEGFFEVGGDSLSAVSVSEKIKNELNCDFNVTTLFKYSNIKEISRYILENKEKISRSALESNEGTGFDGPHSRSISSEKDAKVLSIPDYYGESLAIVGISCQVPGARNHYEFWENLRQGKENTKFFTKEELYAFSLPDEIVENPDYIAVQSAIEGKEMFDPGFFNISPREVTLMDPQLRLLLIHSWKALEDAGYIPGQIPDTSVFMSASNNFYQAAAMNHSTTQVIKNVNEYIAWILGQGGTIPTMISYKLGLKGPSFFIHSNCSSSLAGLYSAYHSLMSREAKYALVGAATISAASNLGYVHQHGLNFSSDGHIKTFDAAADGMIGGEGVAVILLKRAEDAVKEGDHIYAILRGIGINNDGSDKVGFYAPSIKGQVEVIEKVLESKKISPESIGYIEAHGTGTRIGDSIEFAALNEVYRKYTTKKQFCGLGSVKTNIGHLDTASGLAGCIKVAMILQNNEIPPTINYKTPNPVFDLENSPFYIVNKLEKWEQSTVPHRAAVSSFGVGGTNTHLIFEQYPLTESIPDVDLGHKHVGMTVVPLSAKNNECLKAYAKELFDFLVKIPATKPEVNLTDLAYTLQIGRESMDSRVIFIVNNLNELTTKLEHFINGKEEIQGCFNGKRKDIKDTINLFEIDEDPQKLIDYWLAKGNVEKLGKFWVMGLSFDWNKLYGEIKPRRISLPTYPFIGKHYWITAINTDVNSRTKTEESGLNSSLSQQKEIDRQAIVETIITQPSSRPLIETESIISTIPDKPSKISLQLLSGNQISKPVGQVQPSVVLSTTNTSRLQPGTSSKPTVYNQTPSTTESLTEKITRNLTEVQYITQSSVKPVCASAQAKQPQSYISAETLQGELTTSLAEALYMERSEVDIDKKFIDLGLDSIIGVEWVKVVNKQYGTVIPATKVYDYPSIREFAEFIETELSKQGEQMLSDSLMPDQPTMTIPVPAIELSPMEITTSRISSSEPACASAQAKQPQSYISAETLQGELTTSLAEALYMERSEINIDKKFIDLGLDSIIGVEWVKEVNKQYGTVIPATKVYDYPSIREFAEFIETELSKQGEQMLSDSLMPDQPTMTIPVPAIELSPMEITTSRISSSEPACASAQAKQPQSYISAETLQGELTTSLAEALYMERSEIDIDKKFIDLGLDSIIGVEWVKEVNKQYGTVIPATKVYDYPSIREFAGFIEKELHISTPSLSFDEILNQVYQGTLDAKLAATLLQQLKAE
jgi:amino acid adenylation domain-containing protein